MTYQPLSLHGGHLVMELQGFGAVHGHWQLGEGHERHEHIKKNNLFQGWDGGNLKQQLNPSFHGLKTSSCSGWRLTTVDLENH